MQEFVDDDEGYLGWIAANPTGFVLNLRSGPSHNYMVLHRATCWSISSSRIAGAYAR